jgi:NAD(P)-dependent dehydrogenase (short-subunit alcohol dehydrogenase family)
MNNAARAEALIEELNSTYGSAEVSGASATQPTSPRFSLIQADASNRPSIGEMVQSVIAIFGRLDVVASNSGWTRLTNFNDMDENADEDLWSKTYRCNVTAHFWLMHAVKPYLEATKGAFVTTASLAGVLAGGSSSLPYAISKAAQIDLVKTLSKVCAPNIRVNSVSPSLMLTDWGLQFSEEQQLAQAEASSLKRLITVQVCALDVGLVTPELLTVLQDTAEVVRMLLTNESMTGQNVVVDCKILSRYLPIVMGFVLTFLLEQVAHRDYSRTDLARHRRT